MATLNALTDTWNASGTAFNAISMNVTDTGHAAGSTLINLQIGGSTKFSVDPTGATLSAAGNVMTWPTAAASIAALNIQDQTVSGGANVTALALTTGNVTIDCGARPLQYITNNGAFTITSPANDGSCILLVTNGASAGAITFSAGFTVGSNTGDALTTTNTSKFSIFIWRINGTSGYRIAAHQ